jgi:hypothetical protein
MSNLDGSIADYQKYFLDSAWWNTAKNAESTDHVVGTVPERGTIAVVVEVSGTVGADKVSIA